MEFDENENLDKDSDGMHADTELGHNSQAAEEKQLWSTKNCEGAAFAQKVPPFRNLPILRRHLEKTFCRGKKTRKGN